LPKEKLVRQYTTAAIDTENPVEIELAEIKSGMVDGIMRHSQTFL
jgi:hypothetical protein